jgi:hypothetical protein
MSPAVKLSKTPDNAFLQRKEFRELNFLRIISYSVIGFTDT